MEFKREELKNMLAKKWKREKLVTERDKGIKAEKDYDLDKRHESFNENLTRRKTQD